MSGFGKHSGPSGRPSPQPRFGDFPRLPSPFPYPPKSPPFFHSSPVPASRYSILLSFSLHSQIVAALILFFYSKCFIIF